MFIESPKTSTPELRRSGTWTMGAQSSKLKDVTGDVIGGYAPEGSAGSMAAGMFHAKDAKDSAKDATYMTIKLLRTPNPELPTFSHGDRGEDAATAAMLTSSLPTSFFFELLTPNFQRSQGAARRGVV